MILLYNVYLDDKIRVPGLYFRGNYEFNQPIDVFKYVLSSAVGMYPWSRVIINVELAPSINHKKDELHFFIRDTFKDFDLLLSDTRCKFQSEWQRLYSDLNDDLIYFCCNHDHVFIDADPKMFINDVTTFREQFSEHEASFYFSHWQEVLNLFGPVSNPPNPTIRKKENITKLNPDLVSEDSFILSDNFLITVENNVDSLQIITKKLYHSWWFTGTFEHIPFPRTDYANFHGHEFPNKPSKFQVVPYREYCRHFDGYTHLDNLRHLGLQPMASNVVCPLFIPRGFFENDIKIRVGYDDVDLNYVNINLNKENYTVVDSNGTDLKCFIDEIPYFWKSKISEIQINPNYNEKSLYDKRNFNILNPLLSGIFHGNTNDEMLLDKIKRSYNI